MKVTRVAVVRGGPSSEYDVSMNTGKAVLSSLSRLHYPTKDIVISKRGEWLDGGIAKAPQQALESIDVVFLALHGTFGEDGTVQRILHRLHIPYTGSRGFPSAMALNKDLTKKQMQTHGVKVPKHMKVTREGTSDPLRVAASIQELFGPQYVIKPANEGSSLGVQLVTEPGSLPLAIANALVDYENIMVEELIRGKEATVGIVEGFRENKLYILPPIEIVPPATRTFFDYHAKYSGESEEICPGRFSAAEKSELGRIAELVHDRMGLRQYSRSDFIIGHDGIYFLEVNTLPGLTEESLFPKAVDAIGARYDDLIDHLVTTASV